MPTNLVKTEQDEKIWHQAKALAAKNGHKENWGYIVSIYQSMQKKASAQQIAAELVRMNPSYAASRIALNAMSKQAGFWTSPRMSLLDKLVRTMPDFMKPSVQKMIVRFKYPELFALLSAKSHRQGITASKLEGLIRAVSGENQSLARDLAHSKAEGVWNLLSGPSTPRGSNPNPNWGSMFGL